MEQVTYSAAAQGKNLLAGPAAAAAAQASTAVPGVGSTDIVQYNPQNSTTAAFEKMIENFNHQLGQHELKPRLGKTYSLSNVDQRTGGGASAFSLGTANPDGGGGSVSVGGAPLSPISWGDMGSNAYGLTHFLNSDDVGSNLSVFKNDGHTFGNSGNGVLDLSSVHSTGAPSVIDIGNAAGGAFATHVPSVPYPVGVTSTQQLTPMPGLSSLVRSVSGSSGDDVDGLLHLGGASRTGSQPQPAMGPSHANLDYRLTSNTSFDLTDFMPSGMTSFPPSPLLSPIVLANNSYLQTPNGQRGGQVGTPGGLSNIFGRITAPQSTASPLPLVREGSVTSAAADTVTNGGGGEGNARHVRSRSHPKGDLDTLSDVAAG